MSVRPPQIAGLPAPRRRDIARIVWWTEIGYLHGVRHDPRLTGRIFNAMLAATWWPLCWLLVPLQAALVASSSSRYYMTPARDAVIGVHAAGERAWDLRDHLTARPGTGAGAQLRSALLPVLLAQADRHQVSITSTAATGELAAIYRADIPGLDDIGRGYPRGRRLRRLPRQEARTR